MIMNYVLTKRPDGTMTLNFVGPETFNEGDRTILTITEPLTGFQGFTSTGYTATGINNLQYLKFYFTYKVGKNDWSAQLPIADILKLETCPTKLLDLKFYIYRVDDNNPNPTAIILNSFKIDGTFKYTTVDSEAVLTNDTNQIILKPKDIYKVFSLEDFQVITAASSANYTVKYRFTQDNGKTYTKWEPLTKENISTIRLNELRFAQVEYLIEKVGASPASVKIYDIILTGDFQNVSANYLKSNRYGLKQDCLTAYLGGNTTNGVGGQNSLETNGLSCYGNVISDLTNNQDPSTNWKPYESAQLTGLANMLGNQIANMLGWPVDYYLTDPDPNGQDPIIHEYQLYNVIDNQQVTVVVPENAFPDNTIKIDMFNLDLSDTFEIHITKDEFKNKFGIDKRPNEKDFLYFCQTNRMYYVKHAQIFKNVLNSGIYYKVILEKYETKPNIQHAQETTKQKVQELTKNTTIDELFGFEADKEMDKISNKDQLYPKSFDKIRQKINPRIQIIAEKLYNGEVDFINGYYNFAGSENTEVVRYENADRKLEMSENRSFICWFNFNNTYNEDKAILKSVFESYNVSTTANYNLVHNYDDTTKQGYKIWYSNGRINFTINTQGFSLTTTTLTTNVWYGIVINLDQRVNIVEMKLYKRNTYYEITMFDNDYKKVVVNSEDAAAIADYTSQGYKPVENTEYNNGYNEFTLLNSMIDENNTNLSFSHDKDIRIIGSNIKYTNLRVFNDVIPDEKTEVILSQLIIKEAGNLVVADNANRKIQTVNIKNNQFR